MEKSFIVERQKGLQTFLDVLLEYPVALWQMEVLDFFGFETGYLKDYMGMSFLFLFLIFL